MNNDGINEVISRIRDVGIDLDRIECIYVIEGVLINEEPLRVGKGRGELGEVDLPVIKLPSGNPYIPGSSIKGVLRSLAESLIRSGFLGSNSRACEPSMNDLRFRKCSLATELLTKIYYDVITRRLEYVKNRGKFEGLVRDLTRKYLEKLLNEQEINSLINEVFNVYREGNLSSLLNVVNVVTERLGPCLVCQLFGNTSLASHIEVLDAVPLSNNVPLLSRTRVSIDRFRGSSKGTALFNYEFIPKGVEWRFKLIIKNVDLRGDGSKSKLIKSLLSILVSNDCIISFGGMRSVGLGLVKLDKSRCKVIKYVIENFSIKSEEMKLTEVIKS